MNTVEQTGTDLIRVLHQGQRLLTPFPAGLDWLMPLRERGALGVAGMPVPSRRDEAWRYTSLAFLEQAEYRPLVQGPFDALQLDDIDELLLTGHEGDRLVFVNGYLAPALCVLGGGSGGVVVSALAGGLGVYAGPVHLDFSLTTMTLAAGDGIIASLSISVWPGADY